MAEREIGYQGDGEAVRRVGIEQCVRFLGYLHGFGFRIDDTDGRRHTIPVRTAEDALMVACEYTGYTDTGADVEAIWQAGIASGKRSAVEDAFESGAREICEAVAGEEREGFTTYPIYCHKVVESSRHWRPDLDLFLCPEHWEEYQKSIGA